MSTARSNMDDRRKEGNTNADHVKPDDRTYEMHVVRDPAEEAAHARAMRGSMQDQRSSDPARAQMTTGMGLDHELAELIARQRKMENAPLQEHTIMTDGSAKTARRREGSMLGLHFDRVKGGARLVGSSSDWRNVGNLGRFWRTPIRLRFVLDYGGKWLKCRFFTSAKKR